MRKRYCEIKATSLEEVLKTCDRHIKNIMVTQIDLIDNEDGTPLDDFYCNMILETWRDLKEDIQEMIEKRNYLK